MRQIIPFNRIQQGAVLYTPVSALEYVGNAVFLMRDEKKSKAYLISLGYNF